MAKAITGTPGEPIPGSGSRKLVDFAMKRPEAPAAVPYFMPAPETAAEPEQRRAKVMAADIDTHGAFEKCAGCRAYKNGKHKASHTSECRKQFESLLAENVRCRKRFEAAHERRFNAITKKAIEMQEEVEKGQVDQTMAHPRIGAHIPYKSR